jgi:hypothetical protein
VARAEPSVLAVSVAMRAARVVPLPVRADTAVPEQRVARAELAAPVVMAAVVPAVRYCSKERKCLGRAQQ